MTPDKTDGDVRVIDFGGPVFPAEGGCCSELHAHPGMSRRDYFASHEDGGICLQDVAEYLGWPKDLPLKNEKWFFPKDENDTPSIDTVQRRWESLPLKDRIRVICEIRYLFADAMIAASKAAPHLLPIIADQPTPQAKASQ